MVFLHVLSTKGFIHISSFPPFLMYEGVSISFWSGSLEQELQIFKLYTSLPLGAVVSLGFTQPPVQRVLGAFSTGVKLLEYEADNLTPPTFDVKRAWSYISTPTGIFMAQCLVKKGTHLRLGKVRYKGHDSSVSIALGYRLDDWSSWVQFPARAGNFSLHRIQNSSGAHPAS
jgi:hypothetical protein